MSFHLDFFSRPQTMQEQKIHQCQPYSQSINFLCEKMDKFHFEDEPNCHDQFTFNPNHNQMLIEYEFDEAPTVYKRLKKKYDVAKTNQVPFHPRCGVCRGSKNLGNIKLEECTHYCCENCIEYLEENQCCSICAKQLGKKIQETKNRESSGYFKKKEGKNMMECQDQTENNQYVQNSFNQAMF